MQQTPIVKINPEHPEPELIRLAATVLRKGGLVAFPTETVYGLGALALEEDKVQKIFSAKGRPTQNPLIVHVVDEAMAKSVCAIWPKTAQVIAEKLWPGPLTLILPKHKRVPMIVTAGLSTVAVRCPAHPVARALLHELNSPLAAPSANLYSEISPTRAAHVHKGLSGRIDLILDGGPASYGVESTVLDLTGPKPTILRPGTILQSQLEKLIGHVAVICEQVPDDVARASPGQSRKHYAPKALVSLIPHGDQGCLNDRVQRVLKSKGRVGVLLLSPLQLTQEGVMVRRLPPLASEYAAALYHVLHDLEDAGCSHILIEQVPEDEAWAAVRDRIERAVAQ